jgi:hypothetical protein
MRVALSGATLVIVALVVLIALVIVGALAAVTQLIRYTAAHTRRPLLSNLRP